MASASFQQAAHDFQPKVVFIKRKPNQGFGFTLRHFIAYPPPETWDPSHMYQVKAMETIFIKEVHLNGPAYLAGLQTGDRILTVNDEPIAGVPYSVIVSRIKQTPYILKLEVVSKECDVLQMYYTDIAHNPESNRFRDKDNLALLNYVPNNNGSSSNFNTISRKNLSFPTTTTNQIHHNNMTKFQNNFNFNHSSETTRKNFKFNEKLSNLGASNFNNFSTMPSTTTTTLSNNSCDFMARLRKSIEQKEEFLKAVEPQNYPSSFFKTFKSSDNPKRIMSGDKVNNFYALNSMGFSENPKGEDDDDKNFQPKLIGVGSGAVAIPTVTTKTAIETIKDVHCDEHNLYGGIKKDIKLNKAIERYKPVSPITLGIPSNEPLPLIRVPPVFDKYERKLEMTSKAMNVLNKNTLKVGTTAISEQSNNVEHKINDLDCMKSDCLTSLQNPSQVLRRYKASKLNDDNKVMRRISYLRATNNEDGFHLEVTPELMNVEEKLEICNKENACKKLNDLQSITPTKIITEDNTEPVVADMEIKSSSIFGKRLTEYRSWRHVKVELKGDVLKIFTGRNISKSDTNAIELNLKNYEISEDASSSRRKYVFKLQSTINAQKTSIDELQQQQQQINKSDNSSSSSTASSSVQFTEIYFKLENSNEMKKWIELLKTQTKKDSIVITSENNGKQLAEPQKTAAISSVSTSDYPDDISGDFKQTVTIPPITCSTEADGKQQQQQQQQQQQDIETESSSNSVCSPVIKTRKAEKSDKDLGSPKSKNWRGLLFRKSAGGGGGGGGSSSGSSSGSGAQMGGACRIAVGSIGFPLRSCPMSKDNEYVPYIVDVCTKIVETKGLNVVGIYRIPGNKAAISELKDQVNHADFQWDKINEDIRWDDVNVVSSLLKLFIRSLPDALLPSTFYNYFIEADIKYKGEQKLKEIKYLLNQLPVNSYETLKHIIRHLNRISKNCDVNLMEPKNLAIIFGPSIIRTPNETLEIAVKDMKNQCCIVELLVSQYEYFFENGALPQLEDNSTSITASVTQQQQEQQTLLLGNVQKIERKYKDNDKESVASRFIPHLRRRSQSKRSTINSDTYSGESILSLECKKLNNEQGEGSEHGSKEEGGSLEISISLTDEESSNSRISDSGSMSLTTITDTLDSKLRNLRSTSESQSDENDSPNKQQQQKQKQKQQQQQQQTQQKINISRRNIPSTQQPSQQQQQQQPQQSQSQSQQPLVLNENIPFADESPERPHASPISDNIKNVFPAHTSSNTSSNIANIHNNSSNNNININRDAFNSKNRHHKVIGGKATAGSCSDNSDNDDDDDDSEVSTTSDPKESILISPPLIFERFKKRNKSNTTSGSYNKLFRSASFNCRNYSANNKFGMAGTTTPSTTNQTVTPISNNLTKDEKTDMNYTKKRQIQNKQNRSIKRRHTVGGPSDYSATITRRTDNDHVLEVGIRIKNVNRRKNLN